MGGLINRVDRKLTYILVVSVFIASCSKIEEGISPNLTAYNESVVRYFKEVALGFEFDNATEVTRRWEGNMNIFISGQPTAELLGSFLCPNFSFTIKSRGT
jgi:hypothetical protein